MDRPSWAKERLSTNRQSEELNGSTKGDLDSDFQRVDKGKLESDRERIDKR